MFLRIRRVNDNRRRVPRLIDSPATMDHFYGKSIQSPCLAGIVDLQLWGVFPDFPGSCSPHRNGSTSICDSEHSPTGRIPSAHSILYICTIQSRSSLSTLLASFLCTSLYEEFQKDATLSSSSRLSGYTPIPTQLPVSKTTLRHRK